MDTFKSKQIFKHVSNTFEYNIVEINKIEANSGRSFF